MEKDKDICEHCGKHWTEECTTPFSIFGEQEIAELTGDLHGK